MTRIKGQLTTADYLPFNEYVRLVKCLRNDKQYIWELYAVLGFSTALRCVDILSLKWIDILNKKEFIKVERKTSKVRWIEFNENAQAKINELYNLLGSPDKNTPVICNKKTGKPYRINRINIKLKQIKFKYAIPIRAFSTHTFRKTFGRWLYEDMGRTPEALILLNAIFQHDSIATTRVYIGLMQEDIHKVYDRIKFEI